MRNSNVHRFLAALLATTIAWGPARAEVLFSTFGPGGGFDTVNNDDAAYVAEQFFDYFVLRTATRFSVLGGPYLLQSVTLPISFTSPAASPIALSVKLRRDGGGIPGDVIETLTVTANWPRFAGPNATTKLVSPTQPLLPEGYYWIEAGMTALPSPNGWSGYRWFRNPFDAPLLVAEDYTPWVSPPGPAWGQSSLLSMRQQARALQVEGILASAVGVDPRGPYATALAIPSPTPFRGSTVVGFGLAEAGEVEVTVFSVTGSRVRTLMSGGHAAGTDRVTWDGRDERGQIAPAGLYIVRLESAGTRAQQRLIKLD